MPTLDEEKAAVVDQTVQNALRGQEPGSTFEAAERKLDELDKEEESEEKKEDVKPDKELEEEEKPEDGKEVDDDKVDEEGYYADEDLPDLETPKGNETELGKWVLENLPDIQVFGTSKGKEVTLAVKRADDLPDDFEFGNKKAEKLFDQALAAQTLTADKLIARYQNDQAQTETAKFDAQEDRDIQNDIGRLQRAGLLGRFKYTSTDPRFNDETAVKLSQEVLDFYNQENQARRVESQRSGRLISRLSYYDAFKLWRADNPEKVEETKEEKEEDVARKEVSRKTAKGGNGTKPEGGRPRLRRDADISEIIAAYGVE